MYSVKESAEKLVSAAAELAETKIRLAKLNAAVKISDSLSGMLSIIVVAIFLCGTIIILSFGLAYLIGEELNNVSYGFFIVGAFYAITGLLVYYNRKQWIEEPLSNLFIDKLTADEN